MKTKKTSRLKDSLKTSPPAATSDQMDSPMIEKIVDQIERPSSTKKSDEETRKITTNLNKDLVKRAKVFCANNEITLRDLIERAITQYISEEQR